MLWPNEEVLLVIKKVHCSFNPYSAKRESCLSGVFNNFWQYIHFFRIELAQNKIDLFTFVKIIANTNA